MTTEIYNGKDQFFIEKSCLDGTFEVVWRGPDFDSGLEALKKIKSNLPHGLECYAWVHTDFGYAPMASINS